MGKSFPCGWASIAARAVGEQGIDRKLQLPESRGSRGLMRRRQRYCSRSDSMNGTKNSSWKSNLIDQVKQKFGQESRATSCGFCYAPSVWGVASKRKFRL